MTVKKALLGKANFAVDLGDGSERAFYVDQDYILNKLGRPHRGINLMFCYYPFDEAWPQRVQDAYKDADINFAWDYPYDNYFPYTGGLEGDTTGEPFISMKDVRRHGQDVILTITADPAIRDEQISAIAKDLSTYGRIMVRLNHEATGSWFSFNKRASYQEVADFFVRFTNIIHKEAPNVQMILCIDGCPNLEQDEIDKEKEFAEAVRVADIWSTDKYIALNYGWPYEVAEKDNDRHKLDDYKYVYELVKKTFKRYTYINGGVTKPMIISEFNADGDVTGPYRQCELVKAFCDLIEKDEEQGWFSGFTFYQFRDDGRLGLEWTDSNNSANGIELPLLAAYRDIINKDYYKPSITCDKDVSLPVKLRWGGAEDSEGISIPLTFEKDPVFAEANFPDSLKDANLMMEIAGRWFYKAPGVTFVDFMPAFFGKKINAGEVINLNIFAPPASGENDPSQGDDWQTNYYFEMKELPDIRLRFEPVM